MPSTANCLALLPRGNVMKQDSHSNYRICSSGSSFCTVPGSTHQRGSMELVHFNDLRILEEES